MVCDDLALSQWFWDVIENSKGADEIALLTYLRSTPTTQVHQFAMEFSYAALQLWEPRYTDHLRYQSEDDIADFSYWVVSQGRQFYHDVLRDPTVLAGSGVTVTTSLPALWGVAELILSERLGEESVLDWNITAALDEFKASRYTTIAEYCAARTQWPDG